MQEIACRDQTQAYNYIATIALFNISQTVSTSSHKQLPTIFKNLWDELVIKKAAADAEAYRSRLDLYKTIAEPRLRSSTMEVCR